VEARDSTIELRPRDVGGSWPNMRRFQVDAARGLRSEFSARLMRSRAAATLHEFNA
jgi:hypothetical protein